LEGKNIGLLSEAGTPCIADPGSDIVKIAHEKNIKIIPLIGPSSIILSLMASGFNGQNFAFHGYLPIENNARSKKIKELEKTLFREDQTQIFIETPYRNMKLLNSILENCSNKTNLCIASDITLDSEFIISKSIYNWKKNIPEINKKPTIFLLYK
jgi:16S rRNA (cytidine1402-2'-O)-methyltransferase